MPDRARARRRPRGRARAEQRRDRRRALPLGADRQGARLPAVREARGHQPGADRDRGPRRRAASQTSYVAPGCAAVSVAVVRRGRLGEHVGDAVPRRDVRDHQPGTPLRAATSPASRPVRWRSSGLSSPWRNDASASSRSAPRGELVERAGTARCRRCRRACARRRSPAGRTPAPGGRPGTGSTRNGPSVDRPGVLAEVELAGHAGVLGQVVGARHPLARRPPAPRPGCAAGRRRGGTCAARSSRTGPGSGRGGGG